MKIFKKCNFFSAVFLASMLTVAMAKATLYIFEMTRATDEELPG